jgi:hypothetical protein
MAGQVSTTLPGLICAQGDRLVPDDTKKQLSAPMDAPRKASMLLEDFGEPCRHIVAEIRIWAPPAGRESVCSISGMAATIRRAQEILARESGRPMGTVTRFLLTSGVRLLWTVPAVQKIRDRREQVLAADIDDHAWWSTWSYRPLPVDEEAQIRHHARMTEEEIRFVHALASVLGLNQSTVSVIAIAALLVQARPVPDSAKRRLLDLLVDFLRRVETRAMNAEARCRELRPDSRQLIIRWADVLRRAAQCRSELRDEE